MQNIPGLINLMGEPDNFAVKLDSTFEGHHFRYDNEPGNHYAYLYDYCGEPWKTQQLIRKLTTLNYHARPDGVNGNDDCGQMSTWYIFGVVGFYPVTPGSNAFAIGAPQYPKVVMHLGRKENTHPFTSLAKNISVKNKYITVCNTGSQAFATPIYPLPRNYECS